MSEVVHHHIVPILQQKNGKGKVRAKVFASTMNFNSIQVLNFFAIFPSPSEKNDFIAFLGKPSTYLIYCSLCTSRSRIQGIAMREP
jgi:hypothetical protein